MARTRPAHRRRRRLVASATPRCSLPLIRRSRRQRGRRRGETVLVAPPSLSTSVSSPSATPGTSVSDVIAVAGTTGQPGTIAWELLGPVVPDRGELQRGELGGSRRRRTGLAERLRRRSIRHACGRARRGRLLRVPGHDDRGLVRRSGHVGRGSGRRGGDGRHRRNRRPEPPDGVGSRPPRRPDPWPPRRCLDPRPRARSSGSR